MTAAFATPSVLHGSAGCASAVLSLNDRRVGDRRASIPSTPSLAPSTTAICRRTIAEGGHSVSGTGKTIRRVNHAQVALEEARTWAEELQQAEFRGLGDTREAARFRVAQKTGIAESYLKRLRYKWREMGEVAGSQYRALMLAYEEMVQRNEAAAREYRVERQELREKRHEADLERARPSVGEGGARRREMAE